MKINLLLGVAGMMMLSGCFLLRKGIKEGRTYETESGLKYEVSRLGEGIIPEHGEKLKVHYTGRLEDSTEFDSSVKRGQPFVFKLGAGQVIKGWDEAFSLLPVGTQATITVPPELGYGEKTMGPIPANSTLVFDIELLEIIPPPEPFNVEGLDTIHLESGLKYIKLNTTDGTKAEAFRTVSVHYTGYLKDGTLFDSSVERGMPFQFQLGVGKVIKGWDEGVKHLHIGEKARFIIPGQLAYGKRGYPPTIPGNATLIFDVELLEVR